MPGKVNHVSEDRWRECIVDAISFVLRQKQSATLPRISFALRKRHNLPEDTVADRLTDAVSSGWIVLRVRGQETSYRVAKQQQQQQKARKVPPPPAGVLLCIECLKPGGQSSPEPISSCDRCAIALHDACANRSNGSEADAIPLSRLVAAGNRWYCEECQPCDGCSTANESLSHPQRCVVECLDCRRRFHFQCMNPSVRLSAVQAGRTRHRCRKYSDSIFDLSLSLTTGTPKSGRNVKPVAHTVPIIKRRRIKQRPIAAASFLKLPYIVLVPVKLSPAASGSPDAPSHDSVEEISLDSVEAFMGTPKSEPQQKSSPEKQPPVGPAGGCFTPIAPFRQPLQHADRTDTTTVGPEHCGTPKTTRGRTVMGSFAKCRKRMHDGELLLLGSHQEGECKRLRLDEMIACRAEPDHRATEMGSVATKASFENAPVRQVWAGSARPGTGNRASLGSCSVEAKTAQCLIGRKLPRTV
uniref:SAMD1-like winged helix (WH) domain-containing protein n=1 Tax=Anopheles coluzzii TaxID=1518534 RepID=A0A8W7Q2Y6_ANOCL